MSNSLNRPLRVLFLTSEYDPYAKVGGLGDYSGSLPKAIKKQSAEDHREVDIRLAIPFHGAFNRDFQFSAKTADLELHTRNGSARGAAFAISHNKLPLYLIKRSGRASGYDAIYNAKQTQDARKYIYFSLAVSDLVKKIGWAPDVIHANDWHAALALHQFSGLRKTDPFFANLKLLQVIHNMPFLGEGTRSVMKDFGIKPVNSTILPEWAKYLPLPMGLVSADWITAVSPTYAEELTTEEFADGMADFFIQNHRKTNGILNGIDTDIWDPGNDRLITHHYSINHPEGKTKNKAEILSRFDLDADLHKPLLVFISRLTSQKGVDILLKYLPEMVDSDWNAIFLGCGDPTLEAGLKEFEAKHPDRIRAVLEFNNPLAHQLYAAGDILLMPSRYEPCGLSQMIAMRYGCIPVAREVGGLKDSIIPVNRSGGTGYLFGSADEREFVPCLTKALKDYSDQGRWKKIIHRAMKEDFSWKTSANHYIDLYFQLANQ